MGAHNGTLDEQRYLIGQGYWIRDPESDEQLPQGIDAFLLMPYGRLMHGRIDLRVLAHGPNEGLAIEAGARKPGIVAIEIGEKTLPRRRARLVDESAHFLSEFRRPAVEQGDDQLLF